MTHETTRRHPELERYTEITRTGKNSLMVLLKVGAQSFQIAPAGTCEDQQQAEWFRDMLCIALHKLIEEQRAIRNATGAEST